MIFFVLLLLLPVLAHGEPVPVTYTEPSGTGFAQSCVYSCVQHNTDACACTPKDRQVCTDNQNTGTAAVINVSFNVPLRDGQLPACVNFAVTTKDSDGNESALVFPVAGPHIFDAP